MGCGLGDNQCSSDEKPSHRVTIQPFLIGKYEVTQAQFQRFRKDYTYQKGEENLPAANITWFGAKGFCEHFGYRLPTEAEWEYAARAGTRTRYSFGDDESKLGEYAWYDKNSGHRAHPVGTCQPNSWGLYDMHGNVWEWVQDCYHDNYSSAPTDGSAWEVANCQQRVLRGAPSTAGPCTCAPRSGTGSGPRTGSSTAAFAVRGVLAASLDICFLTLATPRSGVAAFFWPLLTMSALLTTKGPCMEMMSSNHQTPSARLS